MTFVPFNSANRIREEVFVSDPVIDPIVPEPVFDWPFESAEGDSHLLRFEIVEDVAEYLGPRRVDIGDGVTYDQHSVEGPVRTFQHYLESPPESRRIGEKEGHERLSTTMRYALLTHDQRRPPVQPIDLLPPPESPTP